VRTKHHINRVLGSIAAHADARGQRALVSLPGRQGARPILALVLYAVEQLFLSLGGRLKASTEIFGEEFL